MSRPVRTLPPGRHGLPREVVESHQRVRIADAVLDVVGERGYKAASVGAALAIARVSRRSFYGLFRDFDDAFEWAVTAHLGAVGSHVALAELIEAYPLRARACLVEVVGMRGGWELRDRLLAGLVVSREARGVLHEACSRLVAGDEVAAACLVRECGRVEVAHAA